MNFIERAKILQNYYRSGNFKKVIEGCKNLNKKFPNNTFILNLSGMAFQGLNQHKKAIVLFESALKADNSNIAALNNLANSLKNLEEFERADEIFKKIIKTSPNYINAYNNYANLKIAVDDTEEAIKLYKKAIKLSQNNNENPLNILIHLANALQSLNRKKELTEVLEEIFKIDKDNILANKILTTIYKYTKADTKTIDHISRMEKIYIKKDLNNYDRARISFGLGKAYDDLKDTEKATTFFSNGNEAFKKTISSDVNLDIKIMNNIQKIFEKINLNKTHSNYSKKKMIFICGMPRSGTTLVEQIVASHPKVYGSGELSFLTNIIGEYFFNQNTSIEEKISEYMEFSRNIINEKYFNKFSLHHIQETIITDKAPFNFKWIGFIRLFFPNSKIIHCKRNPQDNCLSIYKNIFSSSKMNWAYDQKDIANYYNSYNSMMKFWYSKIPDFIYTAEYEKIVLDKKNEINNLLKFCNLEYDDNCFNHHKNTKTPIRTVSIDQARQPIYSSSVNAGRNYKDHLKELFENLD
jgi:tetratricopeptide (TPR) repeat protein